jgi:phospholipase C
MNIILTNFTLGWLRPIAAAAFVGLLSGAAAIATMSPAAGADASANRIALLRSKIKFVFVLYQENRSFDSYFGTFPGADGLYSDVPVRILGFSQPILDVDGSTSTIQPFRIGPTEFAADTDDVDHSHDATVAKMDIVDGVPQMDRFAVTEEHRHSPSGNPSLAAKQFGELAMAHEDCDTVPFLWRYAARFALYDHVFESMAGPSTPGNLSIIAAQTGITQLLLHPEQSVDGTGNRGPGVPVLDDADPFWGSPSDRGAIPMPVNPRDFPSYDIQRNLTFASLPLTLQGRSIASVSKEDQNPTVDLQDVRADLAFLGRRGLASSVPWGWYEEGYDVEPAPGSFDPTVANGLHASYITHHNGPQYFGYVANNGQMRAHLHGLGDFFQVLRDRALPASGGVYYVKGGYRNVLGLRPADPDAAVQSAFIGDDDHPGYSDAQISEASLAHIVNLIARSPYWSSSAIIITWDDAEGDYDHVRPPMRYALPGIGWMSDGPRVPLILISPFARSGAVVHDFGDQASVVKLVNDVFGLTPLSELPDEVRASGIGLDLFGSNSLGPRDGADNGVSDLLSGFDDDRLSGNAQPISASTAEIPDQLVTQLPQVSGYGCKALGIVPTDVKLGIVNQIPADFDPRPKTDPTKSGAKTPR